MENTIGKKLKKRREELNYTVEEISGSTKLSKDLINAMENDNYEMFPASIYLINFMRKYGEFLGLDTEEMVHEIRLMLKSKETRLTDVSLSLLKSKESRPGFNTKKAFAVLLVIVLGTIWMYVNLRHGTRNPKAAAVEVTEVSGADYRQAGGRINILLKIKTDTWVKLTCDGSVVLESLLASGFEKKYSANSEIRVRTGNVYGMELWKEDEMIDIVKGNIGSVNEVLFKYEEDKITLSRTLPKVLDQKPDAEVAR